MVIDWFIKFLLTFTVSLHLYIFLCKKESLDPAKFHFPQSLWGTFFGTVTLLFMIFFVRIADGPHMFVVDKQTNQVQKLAGQIVLGWKPYEWTEECPGFQNLTFKQYTCTTSNYIEVDAKIMCGESPEEVNLLYRYLDEVNQEFLQRQFDVIVCQAISLHDNPVSSKEEVLKAAITKNLESFLSTKGLKLSNLALVVKSGLPCDFS